MRPQAAAFRLVVVTGYCPIRIIITSNAFLVITVVTNSNHPGNEKQHSDVKLATPLELFSNRLLVMAFLESL